MTPYTVRPADAVLLANAAFRVSRPQIGIALYEGVGELDLSNLYDTHSSSAVADVHAVAERPGLVRTAHGLTVMPALVVTGNEADPARIRALHRLVIPGVDGEAAAKGLVTAATAVAAALRLAYIHRDAHGRFGLETVIEDLARTADRLTARFALRRLEYRSPSIRLDGDVFPWAVVPLPVGIGLLGLVLAVAVERVATRYRQRHARNRRIATPFRDDGRSSSAALTPSA